MKEIMKWFANEEEGQGMVEYALILALIAIAAITILPDLGKKIADIFSDVNDAIPAGTNGGTT